MEFNNAAKITLAFIHLLKQVERAFSVCGTIEYMAPEIVEGGESGHDKVIFVFVFCALFCSIKSVFFSIPQCLCSPLRFFLPVCTPSKHHGVGAFLFSRQWTGGASVC